MEKNLQTKEKIQQFLEIVENNGIIDKQKSNQSIFENGLVVFEAENLTARDVCEFLPEGKYLIILVSDPLNYKEFIDNFSMINREGQWLVVDFKCDPHPNIISFLKQLNEENEVAISDYKDQELANFKLNSRTRIICCIKRNELEKITYPYFYNLFGPILNL